MKKIICSLLLCLPFISIQAQWKWHNPMEAGFPVMQNQGWPEEIGKTYQRLPNRAESEVRKNVWGLSKQSAGLAIHFYSNSPEITVRYQVTGNHAMPHMPATGVSGLDLYRIDNDGKWSFCWGSYSFKDTIQYTYTLLEPNKQNSRSFEYRLYLPLYNGVKWMEIGTKEANDIQFIPQSKEKPIVLYGTSIAQGACASRPAMAWSTIVHRNIGYPLINLGFSGNALLEKEVINYLVEQDARLYILDCIPNIASRSEEEVTALVIAAVKQIRAKHNTPILLVEHAGYSNGATNQERYDSYTRANRGSQKGYEALLNEGVKDLHYLSLEELNFPPDAWVDYVHPNDLGATYQANAVEKKVREILQ